MVLLDCSTSEPSMCERVGDEIAAVGVRPGKRGEGVSRLHLPAVGGDAPWLRAEPREQRGDIEIGDGQGRHQVSSSTAVPGVGRITLSTGASLGTASIRNAAAVTVEKTGAATSPP